MRYPICIFTLLLLFLHAPLRAEKEGGRSCRLLYLNAPSGAPSTLQLFDGNSAREVSLPGMNFSPSYPLPAGELTLTLVPTAPASPEDVPAGAPSVTVPEDVRDFYLMITTDTSNKVVPVAMQLVKLDFDRFRTGGILWFNLTPAYVAGKVGGENLALRPSSTQLMPAPISGKENYPVNIAYKMKLDEPAQPICETSWLHDPRSRKVAFVFAEKGRSAPRVLAFNDFRTE